jgi:hypothetical protein
MAKRDKIITEARERFERAQEVWSPIYDRCREDLRFSDPTNPQQWPEKAKREREQAEGGARPCMTFDQTGQFVRQVINTARRNKPAIKYIPVDDQADPKLAEVLQGLARQTEYASRAEVAYITALDSATRGGLGFFRMILEDVKGAPIKGQLCAKIGRVVDFETVWTDPDFTEPDGSDMMWGFVEDSIPREKFKKLYPKAQQVDWDSAGWWGKDHVRICEYYRVVEVTENVISVDGQTYSEDEYWQAVQAGQMMGEPVAETKKTRRVEHYKISGEEVLEESIFPAEYVPIFPVLGNETWEEGKRNLGGCIRTARDAQITYNFERNSEFEAVAVGPKAPWLAANEAVEGNEKHWRQANRGNLAFLPWNHIDSQGNPIPKPERIAPAGIAAGWATLSERSKADIQAAMGMFSASVGDNPNSQSGRAVIALQNQADVGSFHYVDNLALSISHCGRVLTQVWPVIYDQEQVIRILGDDDEAEFVRVSPNMPQGYAEQKTPDGQKQVFINPSVGKYDVRVSVGPAYQTRQLEAAAEIGEMVNGNPQMMALLGDVWVKMRNFPEADKIAKRLKAMLPPEVQQAEQDEDQELPPEVRSTLESAAQEIEQLQQALQGMQAELQSKQQSEELQAQVKLQIAAGQQETARYVAELQAENKSDIAELTGMIQILLQKMQPPPQLQQAVSEDL